MRNRKVRRSARRWGSLWALAVLTCSGALTLSTWRASAQDREPIVAAGHGGFFDRQGRQIPVTLGFVADTQAWYREELLGLLDRIKRPAFFLYEVRLTAGLTPDRQERLLLQHEAIEWLLANVEEEDIPVAMFSKLRSLGFLLNWRIPVEADLRIPQRRPVFTPQPEVARRLREVRSERPRAPTLNSKALYDSRDYIAECMAADVPIPPSINVMDPAGLTGWKSQGFIPADKQFIENTPAEVRTFQAPNGMCIALPRYVDATLETVYLDGVICLSKTTSKVCFWDNQWTDNGRVGSFPIARTEVIPIGVPSMPGGKYQGGGREIEFGTGGVCTDCHAGENPYIIHPDLDLATAPPPLLWGSLSMPPQSLPMMPANRYAPLVGASWPQNQLSQAGSTVPTDCSGCHRKGAAGRFPHLSNDLEQYCTVVLRKAITNTMPQGAPGTATMVGDAFRDMWCNAPPDSSAADAGDPHITTVNNVHYDFQAAGEFVALRNEDTGFELQTRQSPILTSFVPGPDPYTGLTSCASLNTAVALRVGYYRITYQGGPQEAPTLRLNGVIANPPDGFDLGGGVIRRGEGGEVEVRLADGTRVVMIPLFWPSQGYWYIDVQVFETPAREGLMGPVHRGEWLPRAPSGASFGPRPVALLDRHEVLNQKFADAWRVSPGSSLFDYASGTSGSDHTDRGWPPAPGQACTSTTIRGRTPLVRVPQPGLALFACASITDRQLRADCIFDVTVMGDVSAARGHLRADKLKTSSGHKPRKHPHLFP